MSLATLAEARDELKATSTTADDELLMLALNQATARIHHLSKERFEPLIKLEHLPLRADLINSRLRTYHLPKHATSLSAVTAYNTALTVGTDVRAWPSGTVQAFDTIQLVDTGNDWYSTYFDDAYDGLLQITAHWAYHRDLPAAWQKEDDVLNAGGITAAGTSITVLDADGTNWRGLTPRFSPGNLIRIDSEYIRIKAVDTTTNALTVQRAQNGSTAAIHALNADIYVWYPEEEIVRACARMASLLYKRRGAFEGIATIDGGIRFPSDMEHEVRAIIEGYFYE
jgi:hypothetical protein